MEGKKISFGFMKTKKVEKVPVEEKKEFIESVEEKSIKVVGGEIILENTPLVIPMKPNTLITAERLQQIAEKVEGELNESESTRIDISVSKNPPENETIDQMAVRELMEDAKKEIKVETSKLTVSLSSKPVLEGEKESSLDDYEAVPVQEFGMAMLRGMGWTQNKEQSKYKQPQLRPKGLGLGADKVIKDNKKDKNTKNKNDEELMIVKDSFVKITTGKFSGYYGRVVSLDEDNGRVVVDIPIKKETVNLSEFMLHPVTKSEYDKESKVINADTFEVYKKSEMEPRKHSKNFDKGNSSKASSEHRADKGNREEIRRQKNNEKPSNGSTRERQRRNSSSSSEDRSSNRRKEEKKKYSSSESLSSISDNEKKHKKRERRNRRSSSESYDRHKKNEKRRNTPQGKRDIDKKRKGKKKKRDRDRSPNYKKYRKYFVLINPVLYYFVLFNTRTY